MAILAAYLYFILSAGPRYMANRKPMNLRRILIVYNFVQVGVSAWLVWEVSQKMFLINYYWSSY